MRLLIDRRRREDDERRARGEAVAQLGPSPGFRDLQWLKPVYVGDTVSYGSEVIETRPLNNHPGWGMISMRNTGVNQHGEQVISFISSVFVERRDADGSAP
jgi:acyl dehydratase